MDGGDDHVKVAFDGGGDSRPRVVDISLQFLETSDELLEMIRQAAAEVGGPAFELCHVQVRYRDAGGAMVELTSYTPLDDARMAPKIVATPLPTLKSLGAAENGEGAHGERNVESF